MKIPDVRQIVALREPALPTKGPSTQRPVNQSVTRDRHVDLIDRSARVRSARQAVPNVYISHTMWILDQDAFDALAKVDFLKDKFAKYAKTTVTSGESRWSAIYLVGQKTQLEFISANPQFPTGTIGLALGTEDAVGDVDKVESELRAAWDGREPVEREHHTAPHNGGTIPWFDAVILQLGGGNFRTWSMEYDSKFLERKLPNNPEVWGITREKYNRRSYKPSLLLKDIVSVSLKLDPVLLAQESKILRAWGYREESDSAAVLFRGPDVSVRMEPGQPGQFAYSEIEMALNRTYSDEAEIALTDKMKLVFAPNAPKAFLRRTST